MEQKYGVYKKGGHSGETRTKPIATYTDKEKAIAHAKSAFSSLTPTEKGYGRRSYVVRPVGKDNEQSNQNEEVNQEGQVKEEEK